MSLVEAFVTEIKIFDWQKVCLTVPLKALDRLIFYRSKFELELHIPDALIFVVRLP